MRLDTIGLRALDDRVQVRACDGAVNGIAPNKESCICLRLESTEKSCWTIRHSPQPVYTLL